MSAPVSDRQQNGHSESHESLLEQVVANTRIGLDDRPQTLESEQLQIQVVTAKKYPRSIRQFLADAKSMATISQETAASCFYSVPRAGKTISGPSVRLAEICMSCWGHLDCGTRVKEIGDRFITVEGFAWDMQRNTKVRQEVRRNVIDKRGRRYSEDMISNTVNAGASIALRNAILRIIPRAYVDELWQEARKVAVGDARTLSATRDAAIGYFTKMGVLVERIYGALGVQGVEDITIDHVGVLKGFATAIKDGETTVDECFPATAEEPKKQTKTDRLAEKLGATQTKPTEPKPTAKATLSEEEIADAIEGYKERLAMASDRHVIESVKADLVRNRDQLGEGAYADLVKQAGDAAAELSKQPAGA